MTDQRVISCPIHPDESWYCPVCLENADLGIENERDYRLGRLRGRLEGMSEAAVMCDTNPYEYGFMCAAAIRKDIS